MQTEKIIDPYKKKAVVKQWNELICEEINQLGFNVTPNEVLDIANLKARCQILTAPVINLFLSLQKTNPETAFPSEIPLLTELFDEKTSTENLKLKIISCEYILLEYKNELKKARESLDLFVRSDRVVIDFYKNLSADQENQIKSLQEALSKYQQQS
jgi:hypothetical protein